MWDIWIAAVLTSIGLVGLEWECSQYGNSGSMTECGIHSRWF